MLAFEIVNERMDIFHWHEGAFSFELGDSVKDLIDAMIWPTLIMLAFRVAASRRGAP